MWWVRLPKTKALLETAGAEEGSQILNNSTPLSAAGSLKGRFHGKRFDDGFAGRFKHLNHWTVCKQRSLLMPRRTGPVHGDVVPDNAFLVTLAHRLRNQPIFIPILRYASV
jgi:hypothetical protein